MKRHAPPPIPVISDLDSDFAELRELMARVYLEHYEKQSEDHPRACFSEQQRRERALQGIDEILEWRTLASFKAQHLEFLELLIAYWRELEVIAGAPEPDKVQ